VPPVDPPWTPASVLARGLDFLLDIATWARHAPLGPADPQAQRPGWCFVTAAGPVGAGVVRHTLAGWILEGAVRVFRRDRTGAVQWVWRCDWELTRDGRPWAWRWYRIGDLSPVPYDTVWAQAVFGSEGPEGKG
jgi:hypothetical protein